MENDSHSRDAQKLEDLANQLFGQRKLEEAFQAYREAALLYKEQKNFKKSSLCFSQASKCEKMRTGREPMREAALMSLLAGEEAMKAADYAQAKWLFREAGLFYEQEGDFEEYSKAFVDAQEAHLHFLWLIAATGKKQSRHHHQPLAVSFFERAEAGVAWGLGIMSKILWQYGEAAFRPFLFGFLIVFTCALIYKFGGPQNFQGMKQTLTFLEALYMSGVTFTTVGYGDFTPSGWLRAVAVFEAFWGIFLTPLFVIALTRRYLRVYR